MTATSIALPLMWPYSKEPLLIVLLISEPCYILGYNYKAVGGSTLSHSGTAH